MDPLTIGVAAASLLSGIVGAGKRLGDESGQQRIRRLLAQAQGRNASEAAAIAGSGVGVNPALAQRSALEHLGNANRAATQSAMAQEGAMAQQDRARRDRIAGGLLGSLGAFGSQLLAARGEDKPELDPVIAEKKRAATAGADRGESVAGNFPSPDLGNWSDRFVVENPPSPPRSTALEVPSLTVPRYAGPRLGGGEERRVRLGAPAIAAEPAAAQAPAESPAPTPSPAAAAPAAAAPAAAAPAAAPAAAAPTRRQPPPTQVTELPPVNINVPPQVTELPPVNIDVPPRTTVLPPVHVTASQNPAVLGDVFMAPPSAPAAAPVAPPPRETPLRPWELFNTRLPTGGARLNRALNAPSPIPSPGAALRRRGAANGVPSLFNPRWNR